MTIQTTSAKPAQDHAQAVFAHLRNTEAILKDMLDGKKPRLDPSQPETAWIYDQLARLRAGFLLSEDPKCYVTLPGDTDEQIALKGDTRFHPAGYPLTKSATALRTHLNNESQPNHAVLGFTPQYRDTAVNPASMLEGDGALILSKGDIYSLWQATSLLAARVETGDTRVPLIINSHKGLWEPLLGFCRDLGLDLPALNIRRADSYAEVSAKAQRHARNLSRNPRHGVTPALRPGATILVQTSNDKKIHELKAIFKHMGMDVQVLPFNLIVDKPVEAKELSGSYAGNNNEKLENANAKTDAIARAEIEDRLHAYGADPDNTYVLLDDRGLETFLKLFGTEEFARCSNYLNDYRHAPGVELGNVLKSMGIVDFYGNLKSVAEQMGDDADYNSRDVTCYTMASLFPDETGQRRVHMTFGATHDIIGFEPRPASAAHYYSEHYLIPANDKAGRTKAEIPNYIETKSSMARAAMAMAAQTGMDQCAKGVDHAAKFALDFSNAHRWSKYNVMTHTGLFKGMMGHGNDKYTIKRLRDEFTLCSGCNGRYDYTTAGVFAFRGAGNVRPLRPSNLGAFQKYIENADAFLFGPYSGKYSKMDEMDIHKMFIFTSLVVGKQVFDPAVYPKFWGLFSREWDACLDIYDDFHRMGLIGQKPEHIFKSFRDANSKRGMVSEIKHELDDHFKTYRRLSFADPSFTEKGGAPDGLFKVTIYCSATSTDQALRKDAFDLSYDLAANGFAVKNGGGTEGLMRMTSDGVHAFRRDSARMARRPVNAIISDQYEYTMRAEGLCDWNDHVRVHPSIFGRIEHLQDTDAEIVLAGGAGTIQEIVGSMITRMSGARPIANRPMIIVNQKVGRRGQERGVYDRLIQYLPERLMRACNVHVVDTIGEAMNIVMAARNAAGLQPRFYQIANDTARPAAARAVIA